MWQTVLFPSKEEQIKWYGEHKNDYQIEEVFINNGYGYEYRLLKKIDWNDYEDLTRSQIIRQDFVDSEINWLLNELSDGFLDDEEETQFSIEEIAEVRDTILKILERRGIEEMNFYPYLEEDENETIKLKSGDYTRCQNCEEVITWEEFGINSGLCANCVEFIN